MTTLYITPKLRTVVLGNLEFRNCYFDKFDIVEVASKDAKLNYMIREETHGLFKGKPLYFAFDENDFLTVAKSLFDEDGEWETARADKNLK